MPPQPRFTRWPWWRRWFGQRSERAAARYLRRHGHRILQQNVNDGQGEIDLLTIEGDTLVVVEVRSTENRDLQSVAASVNREKQKRLTNAILRFRQRRRLHDVPIRFDVLVIAWPAAEREPRVLHFRNAFPAIGRFQMHS